MNTKQRHAWEDLVQQCKAQCTRQPYSRISVASQTRSDAIVTAGALVVLVTPELPVLLEYLANSADANRALGTAQATYTARALAAKIREALDDSQA